MRVNLYKIFPFLVWMKELNADCFKVDFSAGLTGAIVVLPQGVAFATIAGMPPEYGLYAGVVPAIIAALFGSSRVLVSGPTTAASVVLFSVLSAHHQPGTMDYVQLALTLTFMVGVIELVMGLARLGALVNFISHSVIVGFTAGAAIIIFSKQLKNFFGVDIPRGGHLLDTLGYFFHQLSQINPYITVVGLATLLSGILFKKYLPKWPYMILSMVFGSLLALLLDYVMGPETTGIKTVGALPASLPPLSSPEFSLSTIKEMAPAALAVTLFALTEALSIGRALGARTGTRVDGSQEFIGQGLSNIVGSFFSAYVATGSFNRSALNFQAGAITPMAAIFAGGFLAVIILLVAPLASYLPNAAMGGILFMVAWGLIDFKEIKHIFRAGKRETSIFGVTFLGALFLDLEFSILAGILLSLIIYLIQVANPRIVVRTPDPRLPGRRFVTDPSLPECPQVKFVRIDGSLFFGSISHVQDVFDDLHSNSWRQKHLAVVCEGINFADYAGTELLAHEAIKREAEGGAVYLIHVKEGLWNPLDRTGALDTISANHVFQSKKAALHGIYQKLNKDICRRCDKRIFLECQKITTGLPNDV